MKILLFLSALCAVPGIRSFLQNDQARMECMECISEMQGLGDLMKIGAQTVEVKLQINTYHTFYLLTMTTQDFLIENYCPTVAPDPGNLIQCERDLAGNYVPLLEMVVDHFFVEGAEHICKAWGVCPVFDFPSTNEYTKYLDPVHNKDSLFQVHLPGVH